ncbi:MAG: nucleoside-diphosphate kinase [Rickettsiales bacterium]|nr:nucleoside-diphosphate kinase [Rickettsiales bacterium]|tara:strand:- start:723 stop:1142 length:420 start_codon:yes stop_codon:yes gene_type:complete
MSIQRTLSIVKPDAVAAGKAGAILQHFEDKGLKIVACKKTRLSEAQARSFYAVHQERPFYDDLVSFMTEGPVFVSVLEAENAVAYHRSVMGATNPAEAEEGTVRAMYATNIERNACHGSDSEENAAIEISFFFSSAELL